MATRQQRINDQRIQRAVTGFQIPIMAIVALNKKLEAAIAQGATDEQLRQVTMEFLAG